MKRERKRIATKRHKKHKMEDLVFFDRMNRINRIFFAFLPSYFVHFVNSVRNSYPLCGYFKVTGETRYLPSSSNASWSFLTESSIR